MKRSRPRPFLFQSSASSNLKAREAEDCSAAGTGLLASSCPLDVMASSSSPLDLMAIVDVTCVSACERTEARVAYSAVRLLAPLRPLRHWHRLSCPRVGATGLASAVECSPCPRGSACSTGATEPATCNPGTYAAERGMATCSLCAPGEYQPDSNATSCFVCPVASYCGGWGASSPRPSSTSSAWTCPSRRR